MSGLGAEARAVVERYGRRDEAAEADLYRPTDPYVLLARQGRERAMVGLLRRAGLDRPGGRSAYEIGCGDGSNLLDLLRWGFAPDHLAGVDLLPGPLGRARDRLPGGIALAIGDATAIDPPGGRSAFDLVLVSTVVSSLLDDRARRELATRAWSLAAPGGGVLWHDFTRDNPRNPDVRGIPLAEIRRLFPGGATIRSRRITLAPPIGRRLGPRLAPILYPILAAIPPLRTHLVAWIARS